MEKVLFDLLQATKETKKRSEALKDLRYAFGFNYNKPIKAVKFKGSFTATSLKKEYGIDCNLNRVAVIFKRGSWYETADFTEGKLSLLDDYRFSTLSAIWKKSDFNEWRKCGYYEIYVIAQSYAFLLDRRRGKRWRGTSDLVEGERYKAYNPKNPRSGVVRYDMNGSWVDRIDVDFDDDVFDKSGYAVDLKRNRLSKQAEEVRAERQKKAYNEMTNTAEMISKVRKALEFKKIELSKRLLNCNTTQEIKNVGYSLTSYNGLQGCYEEIDYIEERNKNKSFKSPDEFNNAIARIYNRMANI